MKRKLGLVILTSIAAVSLSSCTNGNDATETKKDTSLRDAINYLKKANCYEVTVLSELESTFRIDGSDIDFSNGFTIRQKLTEYAFETDLINNSDSNEHYLNYGYAQYGEKGLARYTYDSLGNLEMGHLIDKGSTLKENKFNIMPNFESLMIPSAIEYGDTFNFNLKHTKEVEFLNTFLKISYWDYEDIKDIIIEDSAIIRTEKNTSSIDVSVETEEGVIEILIDNLDGDVELEEVKTYMNNGGLYKDTDPDLVYVNDFLNEGVSYVIKAVISDKKNKTNNDTFYYNQWYYAWDAYDNEEQTIDESTVTYEDFACIPVYGIEGLENNIYKIPMKNGAIDTSNGFDKDDYSTWTKLLNNPEINSMADAFLALQGVAISSISVFPYIQSFNMWGKLDYFSDKQDILNDGKGCFQCVDSGVLSDYNNLTGFPQSNMRADSVLLGIDKGTSVEKTKISFGLTSGDLGGMYVTAEGFNAESSNLSAIDALIEALPYPSA